MERLEYKSREQLTHMRRAGLVVAAIHESLRRHAVAGISTAELDLISAKVIADKGAKSNFLGYEGFPATVCISVNDQVVHAIPGKQRLQVGDLVSFDCGAYVLDKNGVQWHGDAAFSIIVGGSDQGSARARELNSLTRQAMWAAIASLWGGKRISCVGQAVEQTIAQAKLVNGWEADIVEEFVGHGIGTQMHLSPDVPNFIFRGRSPRIKPGMALAIEPILVAGSGQCRTLDDGWTVVTKDSSIAAHWEHSVAILPEGLCVLTAADGGTQGLAEFGVPIVQL